MTLRALSVSLALILAACSSQPALAPDREPPLAGAKIGGPFELIDKDGKTVRWADFGGRYRIVYFGYTYCPDVCPTDVQRTTQGLRLYAKQHPKLADNVQPIFVSVDPERDTPEVVGEFTGAFSDKWIGLTGSPEQVEKAASAFRVYYERGAEQPGGGYLVNHSSITYLFGPDGKPLATLPTDKGPQAVAEELEKWVR